MIDDTEHAEGYESKIKKVDEIKRYSTHNFTRKIFWLLLIFLGQGFNRGR